MQIIAKPDLKKRSTLGLGGYALAEAWIEKEDDWQELIRFLEYEGVDPLMIGGGSNLLFLDQEMPLVLVRLQDSGSPIILRDTGDSVQVQVGSGLKLPAFMNWCIRHGFSGLEALTGIPGSMGGAVAMNAGSFGSEIFDVLLRVQVWTREKGVTWLEKKDVQAGYRTFLPEVKDSFWAVTKAEFILGKSEVKQVQQKMKDFYLLKKRNQPILHRTCGCVFKNPVEDLSAGYLLDACGLKGMVEGQMAFSAQHANFLVNLGQGSSDQALKLIHLAQKKVKERLGWNLELEVKIINAQTQ